MKVYQLQAVGNYAAFQGSGRVVNTAVFLTAESAGRRAESFRARVCSPSKMFSMDPGSCKVSVEELTIVDDDGNDWEPKGVQDG